MAGFHTKTFLKHDDYMTPKYAWENIKDYIPKDKIIWECFFGDGKSGKDLQEILINNKIIHKPIDFFKNNLGDILISNPPFSKKKEVFTRLKELDKSFIMICPSSMLNTQYIRNLFSNSENKLQIIIPRKRINFIKNGIEYTNRCNFDCFYYCYKMNLPRDILWLE
jgi:hypothetical protein